MSKTPNPPRLMDSQEFGALMRHAAPGSMSDARLEQGRRAFEATMSSLASAPVGSLPVSVGVHAGLGTKLGVVLALGVFASVGIWRSTGTQDQPSHDSGQVVAPAPDAALSPPGPATPLVDVVKKPSRPEVRRAPPPRMRMSASRGAATEESTAVSPSALAAQLELFHSAESAAKAQRFDEALRTLAELERRYPHGPLSAEIVISRAEYLLRASRDREAGVFIEVQLTNPVLSARRAELYLILGDVRLRQGSCSQATTAYQRALGLGLRASDAEAARRGLRRCAP